MSASLYKICHRRLLFLPWRSSVIFDSVLKHRHSEIIAAPQVRYIFASTLRNSWIDKIKGFIPGTKKQESQPATFTLQNYADELNKARKMGSLAQFVRGRSSEMALSEAFEKQEAIIRVLATYDSTGEHLEAKQKADAAKRCNCTIIDVENALSKFTWAKAAQKKIEKLKEEGKPMPKNLEEVQQLVGSSPIDMANSSLAKSGHISRNADCPCGSKKKYKRCCGKT